jgi:hypothetical protein
LRHCCYHRKSQAKKPGKVNVNITTSSITAERVVKVDKKKNKAAAAAAAAAGLPEPPAPPPVNVFRIDAHDVFSAVARKKKVLLMVQPDPPRPGVCYVLKFSGARMCKRAAVACASLAGHVAYEPAKKKKAPKAKRKIIKKKKERSYTLPQAPTASSASSTAAATTTTAAPTSPDASSIASSSPEPPVAKPRRKLVRGGNAKEPAVLPEFAAAMDAISELDSFLDKNS